MGGKEDIVFARSFIDSCWRIETITLLPDFLLPLPIASLYYNLIVFNRGAVIIKYTLVRN